MEEGSSDGKLLLSGAGPRPHKQQQQQHGPSRGGPAAMPLWQVQATVATLAVSPISAPPLSRKPGAGGSTMASARSPLRMSSTGSGSGEAEAEEYWLGNGAGAAQFGNRSAASPPQPPTTFVAPVVVVPENEFGNDSDVAAAASVANDGAGVTTALYAGEREFGMGGGGAVSPVESAAAVRKVVSEAVASGVRARIGEVAAAVAMHEQRVRPANTALGQARRRFVFTLTLALFALPS